MHARQSFVVQPFLHNPDGRVVPTLGGLETDDRTQALRRAARLWDSGLYSRVMVTDGCRVVAAFGLPEHNICAA